MYLQSSSKNSHLAITEFLLNNQVLLNQDRQQELFKFPLDAQDHQQLLSTEFDLHCQQTLTPFSHPDVSSNPYFLLELLCEALPVREEETSLYWRENPIGMYPTETIDNLPSAYLGHLISSLHWWFLYHCGFGPRLANERVVKDSYGGFCIYSVF